MFFIVVIDLSNANVYAANNSSAGAHVSTVRRFIVSVIVDAGTNHDNNGMSLSVLSSCAIVSSLLVVGVVGATSFDPASPAQPPPPPDGAPWLVFVLVLVSVSTSAAASIVMVALV